MLKAPKFWYQNKISILAILLLPVSLLWIIGTFLKKKFAKPIRSIILVIAVGSDIIGGSAKTPSVIYVCEILEKIGYKPHIISRGYGGSANEVIKVSPEMFKAASITQLLHCAEPCFSTYLIGLKYLLPLMKIGSVFLFCG